VKHGGVVGRSSPKKKTNFHFHDGWIKELSPVLTIRNKSVWRKTSVLQTVKSDIKKPPKRNYILLMAEIPNEQLRSKTW